MHGKGIWPSGHFSSRAVARRVAARPLRTKAGYYFRSTRGLKFFVKVCMGGGGGGGGGASVGVDAGYDPAVPASLSLLTFLLFQFVDAPFLVA